MSTSPYKKLKTASKQYVGFLSVSKLNAHKAYKLYNFAPSEHETFGKGQVMFVLGNHKRWRCNMPPKLLKSLDIPNDIELFMKDIKENRPPFLIFRRVLEDNSFQVEVVPYSSTINKHHEDWTDVPENSCDDDDSSSEQGLDDNDEKVTESGAVKEVNGGENKK